MKTIFTLVFIGLLATLSYAQTGSISGRVLDESGFEVMGANVYTKTNAFHGAATDMDGKYQFDAPVGIYTIECTYLGYETKIITNVEIKANEVTHLDIKIGESATQLDLGITVEAAAAQNTENALVTMQRKSALVLDGISSAQISKSDDRDAASALRRITGVTVEAGKYVYVRGLGDRYSKVTLNGGEVPSLDPNRNTAQMDLFPTNLIDNLLVYKTFSPDLYGDFTGGYIDVATKDIPEQRIVQINASLGYNTLATFNKNFLTSTHSPTDWLGFDNGTRQLPATVANTAALPTYQEGMTNATAAQNLVNSTRSFANDWNMQGKAQPFNHNFNILLGNKYKLFGRSLGVMFAGSYQRQYTAYTGGNYGLYELSGLYNATSVLTPQLTLTDNQSQDDVLWGAMLNMGYNINTKNKISFSLMHNQGGTATNRSLVGHKQRDEAEDIFYTRTYAYTQRGLTTAQLRGKHVISALRDMEIAWQSSLANSTQNEPDLRYFTYRYMADLDRYFIKPSSDRVPARFYRDMSQINWSNRLDFTLPFKWNGLSAQAKAGGAYVYRSRQFEEQRYTFENQNTVFNGDPTSYFSDANLLAYDSDAGRYANNGRGAYIVNSLDPANSYDANQSVTAAYGMVDLPLGKKIRAIAGVRMEQTLVQLYSYSDIVRTKYPQANGKDYLLNNLDFLPALTVNYEINEKLKLRSALSRTLARPTFRELAPFSSFDVEGGYILVGNPNLQRTLIDNADIRLEWFPTLMEMVSVSAFYKHFTNPIERTYNPEQPNGEFTYRNVPTAFVAGAEFELRKNLGSFHHQLKNFSFAFNASYTHSRTQIDSREYENIKATYPDAPRYRVMFGQAPFSINALLSYQHEKGTSFNVAFNIIGKRLSYITMGATPDIYELPRGLLNANVSQRINKRWTVKVSGNNLLNAKYREVIDFKGKTYNTQVNPLGMTFSVSLRYEL